MDKKKVNTIAYAITAIIILLLIVFVIGVIFKLTNGFTDSFKTFYVSYNGKVFSTEDSFAAPAGTVRFDVNYLFKAGGDKAHKDYTVKILPTVSEETAFEYHVNGQAYSYDNSLELDNGFCLEKHDGYFTVEIPVDMRQLLQKIYLGQTIDVPEELDLKTVSYFTLVVTSYDGKSEIRIALTRDYFRPDDINLSEDIMYF